MGGVEVKGRLVSVVRRRGKSKAQILVGCGHPPRTLVVGCGLRRAAELRRRRVKAVLCTKALRFRSGPICTVGT